MKDVVIFTIASCNYLAYARSVLGSVAALHPEVELHLILADEVGDRRNVAAEPFQVTEAKSIGIDDFWSMAFRYDILEFNTAVKPFAFRYFFQKGYRKVIYFDPDIIVYHNLNELFALLDRYSIILTPHMTKVLPVGDTCNPSEQSCLSSGTYNLGFVAISNSPDGLELCDWWCDKCHRLCYNEVETSLFVDQKWMNLVPGFWSSVHILRHQGYNVAYWNLHERQVGGMTINDEVPLIFFHFSGITLHDLNLISKYQNRFTLKERSDITPLYEAYRDLLLINGHEGLKKERYRYGYFEDATPIGTVARRLYPAVAEEFPNPFRSGPDTYQALLEKKGLIEQPSAHMDFVHDVIVDDGKKERYKRWINCCFKILSRVLGVRLYHFVMNYMIDNSSIRKQKFLLDR